MGVLRAVPASVVSFALVVLPSIAAAEPAELDLEKWRGRVVLLDFWASWCGPCKESFPWMAQMQQRYGEQGLVVVAVNLDEDRAEADRFLAEHPAPFEHRFDPQGRLAEAWGVDTMPTSILIDRDGVTVARHRGFRAADRESYEERIVTLLRDELDPPPWGVDDVQKIRGVRPWQKGVLAGTDMAFELDALDLEIDDHIYFSKEASSGGRGFGGGGCGCN